MNFSQMDNTIIIIRHDGNWHLVCRWPPRAEAFGLNSFHFCCSFVQPRLSQTIRQQKWRHPGKWEDPDADSESPSELRDVDYGANYDQIHDYAPSMSGLENIPASRKDLTSVLWTKRLPIWVVTMAARVMDVRPDKAGHGKAGPKAGPVPVTPEHKVKGRHIFVLIEKWQVPGCGDIVDIENLGSNISCDIQRLSGFNWSYKDSCRNDRYDGYHVDKCNAIHLIAPYYALDFNHSGPRIGLWRAKDVSS